MPDHKGMENIIAEALRKLHDISIHAGSGNFEQDMACIYAVQDVMFDVESSAQLLGIAL